MTKKNVVKAMHMYAIERGVALAEAEQFAHWGNKWFLAPDMAWEAWQDAKCDLTVGPLDEYRGE